MSKVAAEHLIDTRQEHRMISDAMNINGQRYVLREDYDVLAARCEALEAAIKPYLGDPECAHDRIHNVSGGRRDANIRGYKSCGQCGADLLLLAALTPADGAKHEQR